LFVGMIITREPSDSFIHFSIHWQIDGYFQHVIVSRSDLACSQGDPASFFLLHTGVSCWRRWYAQYSLPPTRGEYNVRGSHSSTRRRLHGLSTCSALS
jgi:hypothetical protein